MATRYSEYEPNRLQTNYNLSIEIASPVHVGAGQDKNWKKGIDYFEADGVIYVVDKDELCRHLLSQPGPGTASAFDRYLELLSNNRFREVEELIAATDLDFLSISLLAFDRDFEADRIPQEIKTVIRNGSGKPYIPGSSIKGAIRSVLFHYLFSTIQPRNYDKRYINRDLLGDFENGIMRYFLPSDVSLPNTELAQVELFNLYQRGHRWNSEFKNKGGFPFWAETFKVDQKGQFRLGIAGGFAQLVKRVAPQVLPNHLHRVLKQEAPLPSLFKLINDYTRLHIKREIEFFERHDQAEDTDIILGNLDHCLAWLEDAGEHKCLLRLAFGSGFHAMTGDWRFPDHYTTLDYPDRANMVYNYKIRGKEPARYKSRRIADTGDWFAAMGFVKLELLNEERIT